MRGRLAVACLVAVVASCGRIGFDDQATRTGDDAADAVAACALGTHDEDGDGVADACDLCPHLAVLPDLDGDGDGVGDACDPAPTVAGNSIVAFVAFDGGTVPTGWTATPGNVWTFVGGEAQVSLALDRVGVLTMPGVTGDMTVETSVIVEVVNGPGGGSTSRNVGIIDNHDDATDSGLFFSTFEDTQGPPATVSIRRLVNGTTVNTLVEMQRASPTIPLGSVHELRYVRTGNQRDLRLVATEGTYPMSAQDSATGGTLGLRARGVTARFRYVLVVR